MAQPAMLNVDLVDPVDEFLSTVTPDLYDVDRYIDWPTIGARLGELNSPIKRLQTLADKGLESYQQLAEIIRLEPGAYDVLATVLSIFRGAGFIDGRSIPSLDDHDPVDPIIAASSLDDLGIARLLKPGSNVQSLVQVALIAQDAARRRYRIESTFDEMVRSVVISSAMGLSSLHYS